MSTAPPAFSDSLDGRGFRIALVASRFNQPVVDRLVSAANDCLVGHGVKEDAIRLIRVPGAFEIPGVLGELAEQGGWDAFVALGAVIRGETPHFDYVCSTCAEGCQDVSLRYRLPVGFGVLTCDTPEQADARSGGEVGNKGEEAALAALEMADLYRRLAAER